MLRLINVAGLLLIIHSGTLTGQTWLTVSLLLHVSSGFSKTPLRLVAFPITSSFVKAGVKDRFEGCILLFRINRHLPLRHLCSCVSILEVESLTNDARKRIQNQAK